MHIQRAHIVLIRGIMLPRQFQNLRFAACLGVSSDGVGGWSDLPMALPSRVLAQMQMLPQAGTGSSWILGGLWGVVKGLKQGYCIRLLVFGVRVTTNQVELVASVLVHKS